MKHPLHLEPTTTVTVNQKTIPVISLPQEIQHEIATLDVFMREYVQAMLELEKADIVVKHKRGQIEQMITAALAPTTPEGE